MNKTLASGASDEGSIPRGTKPIDKKNKKE